MKTEPLEQCLKPIMRRTIFSLVLTSLLLNCSAQPASALNGTRAAIRYVKTLPSSSFDRRLPHLALEDFLSYETGSARGKWDVVDCPKQSVPVAGHPKSDLAACVQADYEIKATEDVWTTARSLSGGGVLTALIIVVQLKGGQFREANILNLTFTDATGAVHQINDLFDVPMELHRPALVIPKDIPPPVG